MPNKEKKHKKAFQGLPFGQLTRIDTDKPLTEKDLAGVLERSPNGLSVLVRSAGGHKNRGGYFFHFRRMSLNDIQLFNFEGIEVTRFDLPKLVSFVNHCSGLEFNQQMFDFCQKVINFRLDPQQSPEQRRESQMLEQFEEES